VSYDRVGNVQKAQGNFAGALKSYSDSLAIRDRLATSDPGNADWQRNLSVSYEKVGDVQVEQGDLKAALKSYQDDLAITERLATSDPGNAGWQRDLSVSFERLALIQKQSGDKAKAREFLRQGHAIMVPDNAVWKQDLAWFDGEIKELDHSAGHSQASPRSSKHP
jgi:tetratricopeptide (TPR) repeat protein